MIRQHDIPLPFITFGSVHGGQNEEITTEPGIDIGIIWEPLKNS
jgi:hypothetical protein